MSLFLQLLAYQHAMVLSALEDESINGDKSIQCENASIVLVLTANFIKYWNYCINNFNLSVNDPNIIGPYLAKWTVCKERYVQTGLGPAPPIIKSKYLSIWLEIFQSTEAV